MALLDPIKTSMAWIEIYIQHVSMYKANIKQQIWQHDGIFVNKTMSVKRHVLTKSYI
jgi:hypothetical protein